MFRRRRELHLLDRFRELIWPRAGWQRVARYLTHRVKRLPGTSHYIAAGFACGVGISFTPFVGFHFLLGALLAWAVRGSILASAVGTAVGNPWTFPLIWVWTYKLGTWMLGDAPTASGLPQAQLGITYILRHPNAEALIETVLLPMTVGGVISGVIAWWATYLPLRQAVATYQRRRRATLARRRGEASGYHAQASGPSRANEMG